MSAQASRSVDVGGVQPYRIAIGPGLLGDGAALARHVRGRHVLIVSDSHVAPLHARQLAGTLQAQLPAARVIVTCVPAGEASKSLDTFAELMRELADFGATRDACVFALGGGVVGDLAGFAAACWMRGIDIVQLPTTLLAMVDSSVGGKTALDLPQGKNLVGAFHPPRAVYADTSVLHTLPERELRAGLAEVVKYGAIVDAPFLDWLDTHADALLARDHAVLGEAIARSCAHKAAIVERDPFEHGERALLNFGHTFAHAIEAEQGYGGLNHGEAVAVGMLQAARLSAALELADIAHAQRLEALLTRLGLPTQLPANLDPGALLERMRLDKKAAAGGLRFVLWEGQARHGSWREWRKRPCWPSCAVDPGRRSPPRAGPAYNAPPMRMLLQQRPDGREAPRFVQLMLEPDLLGGWTLVRESGQIGGRSSLRREQYLDQASALAAFEHARDLQLKRGFQLMFVQGAEAPR